MTARLAHIWRHPIKGIGSEALDRARLAPKAALAGDRAWALLNAAAEDSDAWQPRRNFLQVASGPALAAIGAESLPDGRIALSHPSRPALTFDPAREGALLNDWIAPLWGEDRPAPARLLRAPGHGMTDMPDPFVSIGSLTALSALSKRAGREIDMRRFRINLWVEGWPLWHETGLIGRTLTVGEVRLEVVEPIERCRAPDASPRTGTRDIAMLPLLEEAWNTRDFGIYARVLTEGSVGLGDPVEPQP